MSVIYENATTEEVIRLIEDTKFSRFPVCGEDTDDIKGIFLAREYLLALQTNPDCKPTQLMQKAKFVPDTLPANRLFHDMRESKMHMAIAVDEYGQTAGLVTLEDLLEEIVGNIYDETDQPELPDIVAIDENHWQVAGGTHIEDVEEAVGMSLRGEEDTYDTFGGFVIANLAYIPQDDETPEFVYQNLTVKVTSILEKRIELTEVTKVEVAEEEGEGDEEDSDEREKKTV
jgi:putative hemolysin